MSRPESRTFVINKLVRDGIVEDTQAQGGEVDYFKVAADDLEASLLRKLTEELAELQSAGELSLQELADIRELLDQLAVQQGASPEELSRVQQERREKMGGFAAGLFIRTVTLPADNEWAHYYASRPERFPELPLDSR